MEKLVEDLRVVFDASDHINTATVRSILENYKSDPNDWSKYSHFDPHKYTRNLVDIGNGKYNLMILCWGPGMGSSIHDHTDSHCFVKVLHGNLLETRYAWPSDEKKIRSKSCSDQSGADGSDEDEEDGATEPRPMVRLGSDLCPTNAVTYISDHIGLHRMENPSHSDTAVTLHLYIPPYNHCQVFDERTGKHVKANVTFYTKFGKKVDYTPASLANNNNCTDASVGSA